MTSRERILNAVKQNQPPTLATKPIAVNPVTTLNAFEKFREVLISIGGRVIEVASSDTLLQEINNLFPNSSELNVIGLNHSDISSLGDAPHQLANVDIAILQGEFAVAENGAVWITDRTMGDRALPFICVNLVLIINKNSIVPTMHEAYDRIASDRYEYGTFIAGPSKTADIEQSLVLGAHGAKTMSVLVVQELGARNWESGA